MVAKKKMMGFNSSVVLYQLLFLQNYSKNEISKKKSPRGRLNRMVCGGFGVQRCVFRSGGRAAGASSAPPALRPARHRGALQPAGSAGSAAGARERERGEGTGTGRGNGARERGEGTGRGNGARERGEGTGRGNGATERGDGTGRRNGERGPEPGTGPGAGIRTAPSLPSRGSEPPCPSCRPPGSSENYGPDPSLEFTCPF
ncbi:protein TonB-like [Prinia subflava]|uniref:protein TonB-like n=1 Tax=Prinia subflava TaxID=208062 RepID=UPI002FDF888F